MKTVVISIDELSNTKKGYPVRMYLDDGTPDWTEKKRALAASLIPQDLKIDTPPLDPNDGQPLQGQNLREILLAETGASTRLDAVGEYLYRVLFRGKLGEKWLELIEQYPEEAEQSEGRRTILEIKPKALRMLPWELMHAGAGSLPLALDSLNPVMRGRLKSVAQQSYYRWPLHVLIVVGSAENDPDVNADEEIDSIEEALIKFETPVEPEILTRPTEQELVDMLKKFRPHIFHFIGHGRKAAGREVPVLAFAAGPSGPAWEWDARQIALDLRGWKPRFAFINACRSAVEEASTQNWGITEAFTTAGVPAVLGMQADVRGAAAAKFPGELYDALARDNDLDVALAKARARVSRIDVDGLQRRDWALPIFSLSVSPDKVVDMRPPATMELRSSINNQFSEIKHFVDRVEPRRKLWHGVDTISSSNESKRLLIVRGITDSGKTWLVYWCLKSCIWREMSITYVSMKEKIKTREGIKDGAKDFLDVLRLIISGGQTSPLGRPLPQAFYEFNAVVNNVLDSNEPAPATIPAGTVVEDKGLPFKENAGDDSIKAILEAFKIGLHRAALDHPLIIALDDLSKSEVRQDHFKNYLVEELIKPIARGNEENVKNIKMILAVKEDADDDELGLPALENLAVSVRLEWLARSELNLFARELCVLKDVPRDRVAIFNNLINAGNAASVSPQILQKMLTMWVENFG